MLSSWADTTAPLSASSPQNTATPSQQAVAAQKTTNRDQGTTYVTPSAWERVSTSEGGTFRDKFSKDPICTGVYIKKSECSAY